MLSAQAAASINPVYVSGPAAVAPMTVESVSVPKSRSVSVSVISPLIDPVCVYAWLFCAL